MNQKKIVVWCSALLLSVAGASAQSLLRLTQAECRRMALTHSESLQQADNAVRQAELDREIAQTAYLPKFDASATGTYMLPDMDMMGMKLRMRGTYMAGISLVQPLYAGGKITTGKRLARIGQEASAERYRMTRMDVLVEADNAYWTYVAVKRKVRMLETYCAQMDTLYRQARTALAAGMATSNEMLRIDAKRTEIAYQLQKGRNGADLCRMSLCRIVGADFDTQIEAVDTVFRVAEPGPLAADLTARPELLLLQKQVAAGKEQIRMARADLLPTVALTANYLYYGNVKLNGQTEVGGTMVPFSQDFRDGIGLAMLSVQIPIFHWGEVRKKVRKAHYDLQNAELDLQKNTRLLNIEVQQAIRNLQDSYGLIRTAEKGLQQARENLRVMRNRYAASMAPLTDLLEAQSQWQQAESNLIEAQTQHRIYETAYRRATGTLNF